MVEQISSLKTDVRYKDTPIGKVPVDWAIVKLQDVCDDIYRYPTYYNIDYVKQNYGIPEIRGELIKKNGEVSTDLSKYRYISKETSSRFPRTILREGDFVISVRGTLGKIGYVSSALENANITANLMRISPTREKVYPPWLRQFFLSGLFQNRLNEISSATTIKTIKAPELKAIKIALPLIYEQNKIAYILTSVDQSISKTARIIEKTKELKKGLMQRLFTEGVGHTRFKETKVGKIPEKWGIGKLSGIALVTMGQSPPGNTYNSDGVGVPILNGPTEFTDYSPIPVQYTTKPTKLCKSGDILICVRGSSTGRLNIADREYCIGRGLAAIRRKPNSNTRFIYYVLIDITHKIFIEAQGSGSTFPNISRQGLEDRVVIIPPINEQEIIASILSDVDLGIESEENYKAELEQLKKGLMQVLLTGKLRVTV